MKNSRSVVFCSLLLLIFTFQNCQKSFQPIGTAGNQGGPAGQQPPDDNTNQPEVAQTEDSIDPNCLTSEKYDFCLFEKNPVAHAGKALMDVTDKSELESYQKYGVMFVDVDSSGALKNTSISIETMSDPQINIKQLPSSKITISNDSDNVVEQVMAYYWLNRAIRFMKAQAGSFYAEGKNIKVITDDKFVGWSSKLNTIFLQKKTSGESMSLNAGMMIHLLAQANIYYATNGAMNSNLASKHKNCGQNLYGCCKTVNGCSRAIASGASDYLAAIMFPSKQGLGETWVNKTGGMSKCSFGRDLEAGKSRLVQAAFSSCETKGGSGEIHNMGVIYGSIWLSVRDYAKNLDVVNGTKDIDRLYIRHLAQLNGGDDFDTALAKIKLLDNSLFGGKYSSRFDAEYASRGL